MIGSVYFTGDGFSMLIKMIYECKNELFLVNTSDMLPNTHTVAEKSVSPFGKYD